MPFLGFALGLAAMCSLGWGNLVAFYWNDLPVGREFDRKFLKKVKSPPYALPPPPGITLIGALNISYKINGQSIEFVFSTGQTAIIYPKSAQA